MKDGYKYENGLVKVVDYNENNVRTFETRDYRDNINEILMTENEIEHLQSKKNYYCEQKSRIEKKLEDLTFKIFRCGMWFAGVFLFCSMWCPLLFQNNLIFSFIVLGGISASGFGLCSASNITKLSKLNKKLQGVESILQGVEDKLEDNKVLMRRLENDTRREKEEEAKKSCEYKQLRYVNKLNEIDEYLDLWYNAGFYQSDISCCEREETLDIYLDKKYGAENVKTMKKIISKRKKIKKNQDRHVD